jgi:hypothetical protein
MVALRMTDLLPPPVKKRSPYVRRIVFILLILGL